jgi:predicted RNase H-like HicB family nuclease
MGIMQKVKIVYWREDDAWLGYLDEYPDYWTQGESIEDLEEHLKDLYQDLTRGEIPGVRKVGELLVS